MFHLPKGTIIVEAILEGLKKGISYESNRLTTSQLTFWLSKLQLVPALIGARIQISTTATSINITQKCRFNFF